MNQQFHSSLASLMFFVLGSWGSRPWSAMCHGLAPEISAARFLFVFGLLSLALRGAVGSVDWGICRQVVQYLGVGVGSGRFCHTTCCQALWSRRCLQRGSSNKCSVDLFFSKPTLQEASCCTSCWTFLKKACQQSPQKKSIRRGLVTRIPVVLGPSCLPLHRAGIPRRLLNAR